MQEILVFFALGFFTGFIIGYLAKVYGEYKRLIKEAKE